MQAAGRFRYTATMPRRCATFILTALMLILPVQGTSAALAKMICDTDDHHPAQMHGDTQHDQGAPHQHAGDGDASDHKHTAAHFCCDHTATGIPPSFGSAAAADFPVYQSSLTPLISLFVPEQPQRPPRA